MTSPMLCEAIDVSSNQPLVSLSGRLFPMKKLKFTFNAWYNGQFGLLLDFGIMLLGARYGRYYGDETDTRVFLALLAFYVVQRLSGLLLQTQIQLNALRQAIRSEAEFLNENYSRDTVDRYHIANAIVSIDNRWKDPTELETDE